VRSITSLTCIVENYTSNLYSSVRIQIQKDSTNFSILNNALDNQIDKNLTSKPTGPLKNKWIDYYFKINSIIIPDLHLKNALNKFYIEKIFNLDKDTTIVIQFKILIDEKKHLDLSLSYKQLKFLNLMNYLIFLKNFEMLKV